MLPKRAGKTFSTLANSTPEEVPGCDCNLSRHLYMGGRKLSLNYLLNQRHQIGQLTLKT